MVYKFNKLFLKIESSLKLILIIILFLQILFLYNKPALSKDIKIERNLAYKYCNSLDRNLFKGLDNERILKYEYFFSDIKKQEIYEIEKNSSNFYSEIEDICSYKLKNEEKQDIENLLKEFLSNNLK